MCNVFKPERCHHCSACNRCVLNMDHHCPWINNCVGFWNRKYFILLLVYALAITYFVAFTMIYDFFQTIRWEIDAFYLSNTEQDYEKLVTYTFIQVFFVINCGIGFLLTFFTKFHVYLLNSNKTTIENLDKKGRKFKSVYDIGSMRNFYQVFGANKYLWPLPLFSGSGKPLGDGIYWPTNMSDYESQIKKYQSDRSQNDTNASVQKTSVYSNQKDDSKSASEVGSKHHSSGSQRF